MSPSCQWPGRAAMGGGKVPPEGRERSALQRGLSTLGSPIQLLVVLQARPPPLVVAVYALTQRFCQTSKSVAPTRLRPASIPRPALTKPSPWLMVLCPPSSPGHGWQSHPPSSSALLAPQGVVLPISVCPLNGPGSASSRQPPVDS